MKIRRVIRFQEIPINEKPKQEISEKQKKDVNSNEENLNKECLQENIEEIAENEQETESENSYDAYNELEHYVVQVASRRTTNNMIGVFGMNSDCIANRLCSNLDEIRENIIFVGNLEYSRQLPDVYNSIAAIFLNYINDNYSSRYDMGYYMRDVMLLLEKVYYNSQSDYYDEYETPIQSLVNINKIYERDRNLLSAINRIKQIINSSSNSRNHDPKFLVTVEMEQMDYKTLSSLTKLNSSDLIIIVTCILDYDLAQLSLSRSVGGLQSMNKFFYPGNYVIA